MEQEAITFAAMGFCMADTVTDLNYHMDFGK
jgi:hypothetical protein